MWRLALPVLAEETLTMSVGWTDWWLTCHYLEGADPKAAMGLMSYVMWLVPSLFAAVAIGATALVARWIGGERLSDARNVLHQAFLTGAVLAIAVTALAAVGGAHFGAWLQLPKGAAELAATYILIITPVIPLIMVEQVGAACLRGAGDTLTGFLAKSVVVIVNVVVSASLITGWGPFPEMGWKSLAIGTAVGHSVGAMLILLRLVVGSAGLRLRLGELRPDPDVIRRLLRIGIPGGVDLLAVLTCQFIFVAIINRIGSQAAAAHGLAVQIEAMAYMPGSAFQVAAATIAGQYLGAKMPDKAMRGVLHCLGSAALIMSLAGVVFFFRGDLMTGLFIGSRDDPTGEQAARLLKIVAMSMPALACVMVISGALRGAGDTRWPLLITLVGFLCIRIPFALVLAWPSVSVPGTAWSIPGFDLGVTGAWYAMLIDLSLRSVLLVGRLIQGGWKRVKV